MKYLKKLIILCFCALCVSSFCSAAVMAASNKAVGVKTTYPAVKNEEDNRQHVLFGAAQKKACKATKNMKLSCTVYIPAAAVKANDFIIIDPMAALGTTTKYYGTIFGKYRVQMQLNKGKPVLYKSTDSGIAGKLSKKYGTVVKKNGYYVVTLKKIPLCSWAFLGTPDSKTSINTKKNFYIDTYIRFYRHSSKKWTGYVYVDNLTLYASKTLKMTFDKKDYKELFAYKFVEEKVKAVIKTVK